WAPCSGHRQEPQVLCALETTFPHFPHLSRHLALYIAVHVRYRRFLSTQRTKLRNRAIREPHRDNEPVTSSAPLLRNGSGHWRGFQPVSSDLHRCELDEHGRYSRCER